MKKIILSLLLCATFIFSLVSCDLMTKYEFTETNDGYEFSGLGDSNEAEIVIPDTYKGKPVTSIGNYALRYNLAASMFNEDSVAITSVTLPNTITKIGDFAFDGNRKLTTIEIPDGVTSIGKAAFLNCASLESITIPEGVTEIKESTFSGCENLKSITLPNSVTKIGAGAFSGCLELETINLPDGITEIPDKCFQNCSSLKNFTISDKIVSIGEYAFSGCTSLGSITIPETVETIGQFPFYEVGENVEVSVNYDSAPPTGWHEYWCMDMRGGKAINTSQVYYDTVVAANQARAAELKKLIEGCTNQIMELNDLKSQYATNRNLAQQRGDNDSYRSYNKMIQSCNEQQSQISTKKGEYQSELDSLHLTNCINRRGEQE